MVDDRIHAFVLDRVIDGDTIVPAMIDLDYHVWLHSSDHFEIEYRLLRVNAPESNRPVSRKAGLVAKAFTTAWLAEHAGHDPKGRLWARTTETDSFGRYLTEVTCREGHNLSDDLLSSANAVPFKKK